MPRPFSVATFCHDALLNVMDVVPKDISPDIHLDYYIWSRIQLTQFVYHIIVTFKRSSQRRIVNLDSNHDYICSFKNTDSQFKNLKCGCSILQGIRSYRHKHECSCSRAVNI